jgi:uncharacterized OB-fold protein
MAEPQKIQPRPTAVSAPYFEGCRAGELRLQLCGACGRYQFYPRIVCSHCGADEVRWQAASGAGRIASFTVVRRGVSAAYEAPYIVALIDLAEGPRMMSQIVHIDAEDARLRIGASVCIEFQAWSDEIDLPVFRLRDSQ